MEHRVDDHQVSLIAVAEQVWMTEVKLRGVGTPET